jgi:hypothetical protein
MDRRLSDAPPHLPDGVVPERLNLIRDILVQTLNLAFRVVAHAFVFSLQFPSVFVAHALDLLSQTRQLAVRFRVTEISVKLQASRILYSFLNVRSTRIKETRGVPVYGPANQHRED